MPKDKRYYLTDRIGYIIAGPFNEEDLWKLAEKENFDNRAYLMGKGWAVNPIPITKTRYASKNPLRKSKTYRFIAANFFNVLMALLELNVISGHTAARDPKDYEEMREIIKSEAKGCLFLIVFGGILLAIIVGILSRCS